MATDVLGRVVEVVTGRRSTSSSSSACSGRSGMKETSYYVEGEGPEKLAVLYMPEPLSPVGDAPAHVGRRGPEP